MKPMTRAATLATAVALVLAASPASASVHSSDGQAAEDVPDISLVVFSTASYTEIFDEVVKQNGSKNAAVFFAAAARHLPEGFPVVSELADRDQQTIYKASAEAAQTGRSLPSYVARLANPQEFEIVPMAWSSYPVGGHRENNNRSWVNRFSLRHIQCTAIVFCSEHGRVDIRMTTDPGLTGTRTGVNMTRIGNTGSIGNISFRGTVYRSANPIQTDQIWLAHPGSGVLWNRQHSTLRNSRFEHGYLISAQIGGSSSSAAYKTGRGECYTSASGGNTCWYP